MRHGRWNLSRTIFFVFAGRKPNIQLALPFYREIAKQGVEVHIWDLCRDPEDSRYLRSLNEPGITVREEFYNPPKSSRGQVKVWGHYTRTEYQDCVFIKADDDVVFYETKKLHAFIDAAKTNPDKVVSALTINNGASTALLPEVWRQFETLNIPLLDVHLSPEYAELSHRWFFQNWQTIINQPNTLVEDVTWLSINCIAYTWDMGRIISRRIGTRSPRDIADRVFDPRRHRVGDEGSVNLLPRLIHTGFVAGHLNFGPQERDMDPGLLSELRKLYADVGRQYLS